MSHRRSLLPACLAVASLGLCSCAGNKLNIAYKDMAREGVFGFQDHGKPVWCRNIKVKRLM